MKKLFTQTAIILVIVMFSLPVYAGAALDSVQKCVNEVIGIVGDPKLKSESAKELKKKNSGFYTNRCSMKLNFPNAP